MSNEIKTIDLTKIGLGDIKLVEDAPAVPAAEPVIVKQRDSPVYMHRALPSDGLGTDIRGITHIDEALTKAGLNYKIIQQEAKFGPANTVAKNRLANVRQDTGEFIEFVSNRYTPFQNSQAYAFLEGLLNSGAMQLENAGQFDYNSVFIEAKTPKNITVLKDEFYPYALIKNSHDGNGSVTVCFTYTRVVCRNTLAMAVNGAPRLWRARHLRTVEQRMEEALAMLEVHDRYRDQYPVMAEKMHDINLTTDNIAEVLKKVFPVTEKSGVRAINTAKDQVKEIMQIYYQTPDLKKFEGTGWGLFNAFGDFVSHTRPRKETANWKANRLDRIALGHPIIETAQEAILAIPA